jgi:hypothetical protein
MRRIAITQCLAWTFAALTAAGCAGNGDGLDENGNPPTAEATPLEPTFASIQQNIFTPICTECHTGATAPVGMRLDADVSYAMIVNVPSGEVPGLRRIRPGDPDASYLLQKIEGRAAVGGRMPLNRTPLSQDMITVVRQWITLGAPRNAPGATGSTKPPVLTAVTPTADEIVADSREIIVSADGALDTNLLGPATIALIASGRDGSFDEGNEVAISDVGVEVRSIDPTVLAIKAGATPWPPDSYRLTIGGTDRVLTDTRGRTLAPFITHFELSPAGVTR